MLVEARLSILKWCRTLGMVVLLVRLVSLLGRLLVRLVSLMGRLLMIALPKRASAVGGRLHAIGTRVIEMLLCWRCGANLRGCGSHGGGDAGAYGVCGNGHRAVDVGRTRRCHLGRIGLDPLAKGRV